MPKSEAQRSLSSTVLWNERLYHLVGIKINTVKVTVTAGNNMGPVSDICHHTDLCAHLLHPDALQAFSMLRLQTAAFLHSSHTCPADCSLLLDNTHIWPATSTMQTVHIQVKLLLAQASHTGDLREHFKNMDPNGVTVHSCFTHWAKNSSASRWTYICRVLVFLEKLKHDP